METSQRIALVTGAARGIGAEVTRQHADTLAAAGHEATPYQLDITDSDSVAGLAAGLEDRSLHVLVNNAAAYADWSETAATADLSTARRTVDTNLFGTWRVAQALLPALRRAGSARVVMVGSGSGSHGDPDYGLPISPTSTSYAISKAAVHALTVKLAAELRTTGILVNAVDPGLTATAPGMEAMGARPVPDGARSVVWAALLPDDGPTGTLTRDGQPLPW